MPTRLLPLLLFTVLLTPILPAHAQDTTPAPQRGLTLNAVISRGQLICGIDSQIYGFGYLNPNTGDISGLQVDLCRALAVATIGEAAAVDLRLHPLDTTDMAVDLAGMDVRFDHTILPTLALQADVQLGQAILFYDGPSVMTDAGGRVAGWEDLENASVCVVANSPSAQDFAAEMRRRGLNYDEAAFPTIADMKAAFLDSRCTAQVLDRSLLEIIRGSTTAPDTYVVWPMPFTVRPVPALYHAGDIQWTNIVDWTIWGLIDAEKLGVTSANVDELVRTATESDEAYLRRVGEPTARLLDSALGLGGQLALANNFMAEVIRQVGNYGEIYDRNLGTASGLSIERGLNNLWMNGGLLDAPTWR